MKPTSQHTDALLEKLRRTSQDESTAGKPSDATIWDQRYLLTELGNCGEPVVVKHLLSYLGSPVASVVDAAAIAVDNLVKLLSERDLATLDERVRSGVMYYSNTLAWINLQPQHCDSLLSRPTSVCGLLSGHHNGFIRALAVEELAKRAGGAELPYLIIRTTDWVPQVSFLAQGALKRRLNADYVQYFVRNLALVEQLRSRQRANKSDVVDQIKQLLIDPANRDCLLKGWSGEDVSNQRQRFALAISAFSEDPLVVLRLALQQSDQLIRHHAFRDAIPLMPKDEIQSIILIGLADGATVIRKTALELAIQQSGPGLDELLLKSVTDNAASVRELVRYHLRVNKIVSDFASFYREKLHNEKDALDRFSLVGAIEGLSETGRSHDVEAILPFIRDARICVQKATIKAIAALDAQHNLKLFASLLGSEHAGVSRAAASALDEHADALGASELWTIFESSQFAHVKANIIRLFGRLAKWDRLGYLLKAASSQQILIRELAEAQLQMWLQQYNMSFRYIAPGEMQAQLIIESANEWRGKLSGSLMKDLNNALEFCRSTVENLR